MVNHMNSVAEVFKRFLPAFRDHYLASFQQEKVIKDILQCRTSALGARVLECDECSHTKILYNS